MSGPWISAAEERIMRAHCRGGCVSAGVLGRDRRGDHRLPTSTAVFDGRWVLPTTATTDNGALRGGAGTEEEVIVRGLPVGREKLCRAATPPLSRDGRPWCGRRHTAHARASRPASRRPGHTETQAGLPATQMSNVTKVLEVWWPGRTVKPCSSTRCIVVARHECPDGPTAGHRHRSFLLFLIFPASPALFDVPEHSSRTSHGSAAHFCH